MSLGYIYLPNFDNLIWRFEFPECRKVTRTRITNIRINTKYEVKQVLIEEEVDKKSVFLFENFQYFTTTPSPELGYHSGN